MHAKTAIKTFSEQFSLFRTKISSTEAEINRFLKRHLIWYTLYERNRKRKQERTRERKEIRNRERKIETVKKCRKKRRRKNEWMNGE